MAPGGSGLPEMGQGHGLLSSQSLPGSLESEDDLCIMHGPFRRVVLPRVSNARWAGHHCQYDRQTGGVQAGCFRIYLLSLFNPACRLKVIK